MNDSTLIKYRSAQEVGSTLGQVLQEQGKLTEPQVERVLQQQRETLDRFGEVAVKLGYVSQGEVDVALAVQFSYPHVPVEKGGLSPLLIAVHQPRSAEVEALRGLRSQILLGWMGKGKQILTVAGYDDTTSAPLLAANLAVVMSQLGERTLLIDANIRSAPLGPLFGLETVIGLSEILSSRAGLESIIPVETLRELSLMTAGALPSNPQELVSRSTFPLLLDKLRHQYQVIVINTPPFSLVADAQLVAARGDGVLLCAEAGRTTIDHLERMQQSLQRTGSELLGCVLNHPESIMKRANTGPLKWATQKWTSLMAMKSGGRKSEAESAGVVRA